MVEFHDLGSDVYIAPKHAHTMQNTRKTQFPMTAKIIKDSEFSVHPLVNDILIYWLVCGFTALLIDFCGYLAAQQAANILWPSHT